MLKDKFAIISVYDKENIVEFSKELIKLDYKIISTSGTFNILKSANINVIEVSSITSFPELLDGRVKTLHPKIHGGILYKRSENHIKQLEKHGIPNIEIVVVNLYPFEKVAKSSNILEEIIENIDIGGPTLLRAAAKNFERVMVVTNKEDYNDVIEAIKTNKNTYEFRVKLATKAFNHVAYYDSCISRFFNSISSEKFPEETSIGIKKVTNLRYGENPHQRASCYLLPLSECTSILNSEVLWGKELSFNNILDADTALEMLKNFTKSKFCCIIKHNTPCGAAIGNSTLEAFQKALSSDPVSAFGGIVGISDEIDKETAKEIVKTFFEVIIAKSYSQEALEILKTRKNLRIIKLGQIANKENYFDIRKISGGILLQDKDSSSETVSNSTVVTYRKPTSDELEDLEFAWRIVKFVKSNAIVLVKNKMTIGICGGQTSRIDSVNIAIEKAKTFGFDLNGAVCASEAFFPFKDNVEILARNGINAIVQPGGSIRDKESIEYANRYNIAMIFTGVRHFKH